MVSNVARRTVTLCFFAALCEGMDLQAAGVAGAGISATYHPTATQLGVFFSAGTAGLVLGALLGGAIADRIGRKRILVLSIFVFGLFSLLTPLTWDLLSLTAARLLTGLGLGGALPNLIALVSESAPPMRRNASVAAAYCATPLGGAVISVLSFAISADHWRWIFIAGGLLPLALVPILSVALPESAAFMRDAAKVQSGRFQQLFGEARAARTVLLWLGFFLALLTLYLLLNWLPILLTRGGLTRSQAAFAQIGFNAGGALAVLFTGRLLEGDWRGRIILLVFVALPSLLLLLAQGSRGVPGTVVTVFLLGCAVLGSQTFFMTAAAESYPTPIRGTGLGAAIAAGRLGSIAGPLFGGALTALGLTPSQLLTYLVPLALLGSVFGLMLSRRMRP